MNNKEPPESTCHAFDAVKPWREVFKKEEDYVRTNNFKNHVAKYVLQDPDRKISVLDWKEPGTSIYSIRYIMDRGTLIAYGDCDDAIYHWSQVINLEWLSQLELSYFASKCSGGHNGHKNQWYHERAVWAIKPHLSGVSDKWHNSIFHALCDQNEWLEWLRENGDEVLGADWCELSDVGMDISGMVLRHFVGLNMAYNQLAQAPV